MSVWTIVRRVENDGGAWRGDAFTSAFLGGLLPGGLIHDPPETVVFTGEGGYEGLTAVVEFGSPHVVTSGVRGFIFPAPLPPAPPTLE